MTENLKKVHPFLWVALVALVLYFPALFLNKIFFDFDMLNEGYAYASHFARHPGDWFGAQYTNGYHSGANLGYNPDNNLFGVFLTFKPAFVPDVIFMNWVVFGYFLLFLWFAYVFFRDRNFSPALSAGLAALVAFSQRYILTFASWLWVASYFVFPALIVVLTRLKRAPSWKTALLGGAVMAFSALSAQPSATILFAVPAGAYAVFLFARTYRENQKTAWRFLGAAGAAALLSLVLSAWYLGPVFKLAEDTPRGSGLAFADTQVETILPADIPRLFLPNWSFFTSGEGALYLAFIGLILAVISLMRTAPDAEERFWRWTTIFGLLYAVPYSPVAWLFNKLPLLGSVRGPSRALFFVIFAIAILAGRGVEYVSQQGHVFAGRVWRALRIATLALLTVFFIGAVFDLLGGFDFVASQAIALFDAKLYARTTGLPLEHYHNVIRSMVEALRSNVRFTDPVALAAFVGACLTWWAVFRRKVAREAVLAAVLVLSSGGYALAKGLPLERVDAALVEQMPRSAEFIRSQPESGLYRAFSLFYGSSKFEFLDTPSLGRAAPDDQVAYARDLLAVNGHLRYGVQSIDGYDNFMTRRTSNLLNEVLSESMPTGNRIARSKMTRAEKIALFESRLNILGMMNVKYVLTAYELSDSRLKPVWAGETTSRAIPIRIYENSEVLPRIFLAKRVTPVPSDEALALAEVLKPGRNFHEETLFECGDCSLVESTSTADRVGIVSYAPGDVRLKTYTSSSRLLVFNENRLRGWQATVDGAIVPTYFTNYLYQGVIIPAGEHDVQFMYGRP